MIKYQRTILDYIFYGNLGNSDGWSFFHKENGYHRVGKIYPTKETLLSDMSNYLTIWE